MTKKVEAPKAETKEKETARYVTVFGAGITGLTVAHELASRGIRVTVIAPEINDNILPSTLDRGIGGMARSQFAVELPIPPTTPSTAKAVTPVEPPPTTRKHDPDIDVDALPAVAAAEIGDRPTMNQLLPSTEFLLDSSIIFDDKSHPDAEADGVIKKLLALIKELTISNRLSALWIFILSWTPNPPTPQTSRTSMARHVGNI